MDGVPYGDVICIQPPHGPCEGVGWIKRIDHSLPEDHPDRIQWDPCGPCEQTGKEPIPYWPPPPEWCHPRGNAATAPLSWFWRTIGRRLPWGPE